MNIFIKLYLKLLFDVLFIILILNGLCCFLPCFIFPLTPSIFLTLWVKITIFIETSFLKGKNLIVYIKTITIQTHGALCIQCLSMCGNILSNLRIAPLFIKCVCSNLMTLRYVVTKIPSQHDPYTYVEDTVYFPLIKNACLFSLPSQRYSIKVLFFLY